NETYTTPMDITFDEGINTLYAWANDSVGNIGSDSVSFIIDTTNPILNIINPINTIYHGAQQLLNISASDLNGIDSVWYNWDGTNETYTTPMDITFDEGINTLYAWANDSVGNIGSDSVSFIIDTTDPSLDIISPMNLTYYNTKQLLNISATDNYAIDSIWYNWDGTNETYTNPINITFDEGLNTIYVWVEDVAGNVVSDSKTFTIDTDPILLYGTAYDIHPGWLDPANSNYYRGDKDVISQVCDSLYKYNLSDPKHEIIPVLATDFPTINGLTLTISLQQGVTFQDGTKFNATAVKWNFDRLMHFLNYSGNDWLPSPFNVPLSASTPKTDMRYFITDPYGKPLINKTTILDEYTVNITLNYPEAKIFSLFSHSAFHFISPTSTPANDYINITLNEDLVGTGPFEFDEYIENTVVKLLAYENYWQGAPKIGGVNFLIYSNSSELNNALINGEIHLIDTVASNYIDDFESNSTIDLVEAGFSVATNHIQFNCDYVNKTWREAISYAIDYQYIIDVDSSVDASRLKSPVPDGILYSNYSLDIPILNVTYAREVMQSMGYGVGQEVNSSNDAWWEAQSFNNPGGFGSTFTITVQNNNDDRQNAAATIADSLQSIGIDCDVNEIEFSTLVEYLVDPSKHDQAEAIMVGWAGDLLDPDNYLTYAFLSSSSLCMNYSNSQVDDLIADGQTELDPDAREAIYDEIQQILMEEDFPMITLFTVKSYDAYLPFIKGWVPNNIGQIDFYTVYFRRE
ncbi:MAG: ABC transporter substrate-binding protein, partial [Promethearchaeota archaeon]